eukprot:scaffold4331_cov400-Prasinococcus_capsulatus_cf.AAC.4
MLSVRVDANVMLSLAVPQLGAGPPPRRRMLGSMVVRERPRVQWLARKMEPRHGMAMLRNCRHCRRSCKQCLNSAYPCTRSSRNMRSTCRLVCASAHGGRSGHSWPDLPPHVVSFDGAPFLSTTTLLSELSARRGLRADGIAVQHRNSCARVGLWRREWLPSPAELAVHVHAPTAQPDELLATLVLIAVPIEIHGHRLHLQPAAGLTRTCPTSLRCEAVSRQHDLSVSAGT